MNTDYRVLYKVAALEFLNNISLDGSYNDKTNVTLGTIKSNEENIDDMKVPNEDKGFNTYEKSKISSSEQPSFVNRLLTKRMFESFWNFKRRPISSSSTSSISDEKGNLKTKLNKPRLILVSPNHKTPFTICSILPFKRRKKLIKSDGITNEKTDVSRSRLISGNSGVVSDNATGFNLIQLTMEEDASYQHLLKPIIYQESKNSMLNIPNKSSTSISTSGKLSKSQEMHRYDPNLLDDPEIINSRKKVVLLLPSYLTSIINYVRPIDMKSDINDQFRQRFPEIKLTLSKIRSLKENIQAVAKKSGIDLWTVANAFVYFETLVLKNLVTKNNRKLCCAAALILSAKINDIRGSELTTTIQELESMFRIHRREIFQYELYVFISLEFGLLCIDKTVNVHYKRLVKAS